MTTAGLDLRALPPDQLSMAERLALAPEADRMAVLSAMVDDALEALEDDWRFWGRPDQFEPRHDWRVWLVMQGRGTGKTRTGSQTTNEKARKVARLALVGATAADVRDVMIEGPSGIMATAPKGERPKYEPSKRRATWPNGAVGITYSDADPEQLRGFEGEFAWVDELGKYRHADETWSNLAFAMRAGTRPQRLVTTTPRRIPALRALLLRHAGDPERRQAPDPRIVVTRGSTYRNLANLAPDFIEELLAQYEGTRLGEQELHGVLLEDVEGALWKHATLEAARWKQWTRTDSGLEVPLHVTLREIAVGVDPPGSTSTECGIIVAGRDGDRPRARGFVLDDRSRKGSPAEWGRAAVKAYHDWQANTMVVERNYGGDMVRHTIATVPPFTEDGKDYPGGEAVYFAEANATRGKTLRAEPVAALYEQDPSRVWHVGRFPDLEGELTTWVENDGQASPNRLDALVWVLTHLLVGTVVGKAKTSGQQIAAARLPSALG